MKLLLRVVPVLLLALLACAAALHPWGFLYALGLHPYPGPQTPWTYQMWSGIVPALTVLTLFGSLGGAYHLHNCHWDGCWRIGKHRIAGTPWCDHHKDKAVPAVSTEELLAKILREVRMQTGIADAIHELLDPGPGDVAGDGGMPGPDS